MNTCWPILRLVVIALLTGLSVTPGRLAAQIETIGSEHLVLRMPAERSTLGRDLASELERGYLFMNRSTGNGLPKKVIVAVTWDQPDNSCDLRTSLITIGMRQPAASVDPRTYLSHSIAKELARLGLLEISGGAQREDTEFLFEGMAEILVHEYEHRSRGLESAWVICKFLDDMKLLGLAAQRSWTGFSSGRRCFRNAAPGITLLTTYRESLGRDVPLKFFEALKKNSLSASLALAFRASATEVENSWLKKIREFQPVDEITTDPEDVPQLLQTALVPGTARAGTTLELQFFFRNIKNDLLPEGVFVRDERTGRVLQPKLQSDKSTSYMAVKLPLSANCPPGDYSYRVTAIDESGNLRSWTGGYKVKNAENTE